MTMPQQTQPTLLDIAIHYATNRHLEIFPANPRNKTPLTANGMKDATRDIEQIRAWWTQHPDALIACRIPPDQIVLDIDPRHGGDTTWAELEQAYATIISAKIHLSGRNDGGAHHWFKRPAGKLSARKLHEWARHNNVGHPILNKDGTPTGKWTSGIDILHHDHRYSILPPSPHPETGQPYQWSRKDEPGEMPAFLADLITADPEPAKPAPTPTVGDSIADRYNQNTRWADILTPHGWTLVAGDGETDGSKWRHPTASADTSASIRHGCLFVYTPNTHFPETEPGDPHGITKFRAYATLNHGGNMSHAARHLAPTAAPLDWETPPPAPVNDTTHPRNLPDTFWNTRPTLQHIRQAAHARTRSADAVLAATLARIAALIPPTTTLPPIVGGKASLNYLTAILATSGGGKSTSNDVAKELVPIDRKDVVADIPPGSGEGLIELYFELVPEEQADGKTRKVKRQTKTGALIYLDEGQALAEMGNRKGATLLPTLRSAWSGAVIGQSNATQETHRVLKAHTYRMAIVIGFQLEYAAALISDQAGGTPQRFVFASATDPHIPDTPPEWPGTLTITPPPTFPGGTHINFHPDIVHDIYQRAKAITKGEHTPDPLDSHADLVRMKISALLAILDKRPEVNPDDWELAGQILTTSNHVRQHVITYNQHQQHQQENAYALRLARREIVAGETAEERALLSGARSVANKAHKAQQPVTRKDLATAISGRARKLVGTDRIIDYALDNGWIVAHGDQFTAGQSKPT
jgi:hypothetical protein